jgi:hypothetical protein
MDKGQELLYCGQDESDPMVKAENDRIIRRIASFPSDIRESLLAGLAEFMDQDQIGELRRKR